MKPLDRAYLCISLILILSLSFIGTFAEAADETRIQAELNDALLLYEKGKTDVALYKLQQVQARYPKNVDVLFKLGEIAIASKNWAYAINVLDKAAELKPTDIEVRSVLMNIYRAYQMPIQEIKTGKEIVALDPEHKVALRKLAFLYHDQNMPEEEEKIRRAIMQVVPNDVENLQNLSRLFFRKGEIWEEILVHEKILTYQPEKWEHKIRLARLYGLDGNMFQKMKLLDEICHHGRPESRDICVEYRKTHREYKKSLSLHDTWSTNAKIVTSEGEEDKLTRAEGKLAVGKYSLSSYSSLTIDAGYKNLHYEPKTILRGSERVQSLTAAVACQRSFSSGRDLLKLLAGIDYITLSGALNPKNPADDNGHSDSPWLDGDASGGTSVALKTTYTRKLTNAVDLSLYFERKVMEDLDAYVHLKEYNRVGVKNSFHRSDGGTFSLKYDYAGIEGGNRRHRVLGHIYYPLYFSHAIHDYLGKRVGPLHDNPAWKIAGNYKVEYLRDKQKSVFYETYSGDLRHTLSLNVSRRLGRHIYAEIQGVAGKGNDWEIYGGNIGFAYRNDSPFTFEFTYFYEKEKNTKSDQLNSRYTGESKSNALMINLTWQPGK